MSTYLLLFTKTIPVYYSDTTGLPSVHKTKPWETTIEANGQIDAEQIASRLGSMLRVRQAKGYDIRLDSVIEVE